jgi:hypothetical protein
VLAALEGAGIAILRQQQVLATPIGARYCVAAASRAGLNMSICEFDSSAHALAGRTRSLELFRAIQRRTLRVNGKTLLTLIVARQDPVIVAQRDAAEHRFAALSGR